MKQIIVIQSFRLWVIIGVAFIMAGCSTVEMQDPENWSASKLYSEAKASLDREDYQFAIEDYEALISRYPFGEYAQQAQLDVAYAYYQYNEPESAISSANYFIRSYPRHKNVDYAYYLKGLARFDQGMDSIDQALSLDTAERDPRSTDEALRYFSDVVIKFPESVYAQDAVQRIIYLKNKRARHELYVASYYMKRGAYVAAANRAKEVVVKYHRSTSVPDALTLMVKAYVALDMKNLADEAFQVFKLNYPESPELTKLSKTLGEI